MTMPPSFLAGSFLFLQAANILGCDGFVIPRIVRRMSRPLIVANRQHARTELFSTTDATYLPDSGYAAQLFQQIDLDHNGVISYDELYHYLLGAEAMDDSAQGVTIAKPIFETLDLNHDGQLNLDELIAGMKQHVLPTVFWSKFDIHRFVDGLNEDVTQLFQIATAHGDGTVSKEVLRDHLTIRAQGEEEEAETAQKALDNLLALIHQERATRDDVTSAFVCFYALQEALTRQVNSIDL